MAAPELFTNNFGEWLEANGVTWVPGSLFTAVIDLNTLKIGVLELMALGEDRLNADCCPLGCDNPDCHYRQEEE